MQEGFGSTSLALSRLMRDLKQMIKEETKGRKRVLIAVYQEGLNRINHIEALRREFGSAIRHSGVSSNGGAQSPKANWLVPKAYVDKLVDRPAAPYTKKIAKGIEYWAPEPGQPVFASQNYEWHMAPGASQAREADDTRDTNNVGVDSITGKPSTYPHADHQHTISQISDWTART
eukprot:tig00000552_g2063.t1